MFRLFCLLVGVVVPCAALAPGLCMAQDGVVGGGVVEDGVVEDGGAQKEAAQDDTNIATMSLSDKVDKLLGDKQAQQAIDLMAKVSDDQMSDVLHRQRGAALSMLGQTENARKQYDAAVAKGPDNASNYLARGYFIAEHSTTDALPDFQKAVELDDSNTDAVGDLGAVLAMLSRYKDAEPHLRRALELDPNNPGYLTNLAEALRNTDRAEEALDVTKRALKLDDQFRRAYFVQGLVMQSLDQHSQAAKSYTTAIKINPSDVQSHFNRGNCYYDLGDYDRARADYLYCVQQNPKDASALISLAYAEHRADDIREALSHAKTVTEIAPKNVRAWLLVGTCLGDLEQYKEAYDVASTVIKLSPESSDGYAQRAWICRQMGDYEKGLKDALAALKFSPDDQVANYNAGICSHKLQKWDAAVNHFTVVLDAGDETEDDTIWRLRSECYEKLGKQDASAADRAVADKINVPLDKDNLALLKILAGNQPEAFIQLLSPSLRPYIDATAIAVQLNRIESEAPFLDELMRRIVQPHAQHGNLETRIVFRADSGEPADEINLLVHRDKDGQLLSIDLQGPSAQGPSWSCGTRGALQALDNLKDLETATKKAEKFLLALFGKDVQMAIDAAPKSTPERAVTALHGIASNAFGKVNGYSLQDIVISNPTVTEGLPMISVFSLVEGDEENFIPCETRLAVAHKLQVGSLNFGDEFTADYFTANTRFAKQVAKALGSGEIAQYANLWFKGDQEDVTDALTRVYVSVLKKKAGDLKRIRPGSVDSRVVIDDGIFRRKSTFVAEFENVAIPLTTTERFGKLVECLTHNDRAGFEWVSSNTLRDHWQPQALADLKAFSSAPPKDVVKMLRDYGGFDSVSEQQIASAQSQFERDLGEIKKISPAGATYADFKWTFFFDVQGSKSNGRGRVVLGQSSFERKLITINLTPNE